MAALELRICKHHARADAFAARGPRCCDHWPHRAGPTGTIGAQPFRGGLCSADVRRADCRAKGSCPSEQNRSAFSCRSPGRRRSAAQASRRGERHEFQERRRLCTRIEPAVSTHVCTPCRTPQPLAEKMARLGQSGGTARQPHDGSDAASGPMRRQPQQPKRLPQATAARAPAATEAEEVVGRRRKGGRARRARGMRKPEDAVGSGESNKEGEPVQGALPVMISIIQRSTSASISGLIC